MIRRYLNHVGYTQLREGMWGAIANLIISGSGLSCIFCFVEAAELSIQPVSFVPKIMLVYVVPLLLIGLAAGMASYRYRFGRVMMVFAALLGSFLGFLAGGILLSILETSIREYYVELPIIQYAGWVALTTTLVGILLAIGVIILVGSIRKAGKRTS